MNKSVLTAALYLLFSTGCAAQSCPPPNSIGYRYCHIDLSERATELAWKYATAYRANFVQTNTPEGLGKNRGREELEILSEVDELSRREGSFDRKDFFCVVGAIHSKMNL